MALPIPGVQSDPAVVRRSKIGQARIPQYALAAIEALRFDGGGDGRLRTLDDTSYRKLLDFCDRAQLTLLLNHVGRDALPGWVRTRIDRNISDYSERFDRLKSSLFEIADVLESLGIEFVVLKGLTHAPDFTPDPLLRAQGDIDIWCSRESVLAARDALLKLGYRPFCSSEGRHLAPMARPARWEWRGDFFASDLPITVDLHYQLWDGQSDLLPAPGEQEFWDRSSTAYIGGRRLPVLSATDILAFAALHLLMHVLHGDLRLQRAWELANFLDTHSSDEVFWSQWRQHHPDALRGLEAIVFRLVSDWFGCELSRAVHDETERLPEDVQLWMGHHSLAPVEALFHPNKDEIWLHVSLVESLRDKWSILLRRALPLRLRKRSDPGAMHPAPRSREQWKRDLYFAATRLVHHARTLFPALLSGVQWCWERTRLGRDFLRFEGASILFSLGAFIFLILYNLYLLELGFRENVLGQVASCMTLGTLLGAMPAAALTRRVGLRGTLFIAVLGSAASALLRVLSINEAWLLSTAFLNGLFLSAWAVSYSPAIAGLTGEGNRRLAFSLDCATAMTIGVLGGLAGGRLPGLVGHLAHATGPVESKRMVLWLASGLISLAAFPLARLRFQALPKTETRIYPRGRFLLGFLVSLGCWSAATGAFNPFFNAFFAGRMRMSVERIGLTFSCSQASQLLALLLAPTVLKRLGEVAGIASMMLATALALAALAFSPAAGMAASVFVVYMSLQYMSTPGLFSMLMSRVAPGERSGASGLYFLVTSLAGSASALVAGVAISRFGYPSVLIASACTAALAAFLFRARIHEEASAIKSPTSC
jgi:predicted MFS family arabinose efflux permease